MTHPPIPVTRQLAARLYSIQYAAFSDRVITTAKQCIQDFLGVAIAGSGKTESNIWKSYIHNQPRLPQASVFQPGFERCSVEQAAALNAVFGHVMDMDDVHNSSITHLAAITIPTAIALGQKLKSSGYDVLEAIVSGYEAGARIGESITPSSYQYWHTTGVVGAFSSGTAAAKLLKLSQEQLLNCLGSAGTQSAGLWEFLENGSMSKVLHTANANLCGIRAASLAALGFTGASTILEGERGLLRAVAPKYKLEYLTQDGPYQIEQTAFKPYACCRHTHSACCCAKQLLSSCHFDPSKIVSITDDTYSAAFQTADNPCPQNPYAAKFSLQFCIAAIILFDNLNDQIFTPEYIRNPMILELMKKIEIRLNPILDAQFRQFPDQWPHRLTIHLSDGQTITGQVDSPVGDPKNPFTQSMADQKFLFLTEEKLGSKTAGRLLSRIHCLEELSDINELFSQN